MFIMFKAVEGGIYIMFISCSKMYRGLILCLYNVQNYKGAYIMFISLQNCKVDFYYVYLMINYREGVGGAYTLCYIRTVDGAYTLCLYHV